MSSGKPKSGRLLLLSAVAAMVVAVAVLAVTASASGFFQKSTDLTGEGIGRVRLGALETSAAVRVPGDFEVPYHSYAAEPGVSFQADDAHRVVFAEGSSNGSRSSRGVAVGDSLARAEQVYGDGYRRLYFVEMYGSAIRYKDSANGTYIDFFFNDSGDRRIEHIELGFGG